MLNKVRIPFFPCEDKFVWKWNPSGDFTVKSAYHSLLRDINSPHWWKQNWNPHLITKINFF